MLHVDANFPGGGVDHVCFPDTNVIQFEAPMDESPQSLWYYFRIRGGAGRHLTLKQIGLEHVLGVFESRGYSPVIPVFREYNGDWERVDESRIIYSDNPLFFSFEIEPETDECFVAFCFPYQYQHWDAFVSKLPKEVIHRRTIGKTMEGRDYPCVMIGYPDSPSVKQLVMISARHHAGEVSGSYALEGIINCLTDSKNSSILNTTVFCVIPFIDFDSVEEGRYGKDRFPIDFNRDWKRNPYHQELGLIQAEIERLTKRYQLVWALDLHAPQPGGASYMPPSTSYPYNSDIWRRTWCLAIAFEERCKNEGISFHLEDVDTEVLNWGGKDDSNLMSNYYYVRWNCPFNLLELSYHRDHDLKPVTRAYWRKIGYLLGETLIESVKEPTFRTDALDISRIPAWEIPPKMDIWQTIRKVQSMRLDEGENRIVLHPLDSKNYAWVVSPTKSFKHNSCMHVKLVSKEDCCVSFAFSFFDQGLLVKRLRDETLQWKGELLLDVPIASENNSEWNISLIAENINGELRMEVL